jgi:hypothetical protein
MRTARRGAQPLENMGEEREETGLERSVSVPRQFTAFGANAAKALRFRASPEVGGEYHSES